MSAIVIVLIIINIILHWPLSNKLWLQRRRDITSQSAEEWRNDKKDSDVTKDVFSILKKIIIIIIKHYSTKHDQTRPFK